MGGETWFLPEPVERMLKSKLFHICVVNAITGNQVIRGGVAACQIDRVGRAPHE